MLYLLLPLYVKYFKAFNDDIIIILTLENLGCNGYNKSLSEII